MRGKWMRAVCAIVILALLCANSPQPVLAETDGAQMHVYCIDLKGTKGDATLVECNGAYLLMDTGSKESAKVIMDFLDRKGVKRLSIYISHFHSDHAGGLMNILNSGKYTYDKLYVPVRELLYQPYQDAVSKNLADSAELKTTKGALDRWDALSTVGKQRRYGYTFVPLKQGDTFTVGNAAAAVIGPGKCYLPSEFEKESASISSETQLEHAYNNSSLVTMISCSGVKFLNGGDIEAVEEKNLLQTGVDLDADIFKMDHHGTDTSNIPDFLKAVTPSYSFSSYYCNKKELDKQNQIYKKNKLTALLVSDTTAATTVYGYIRTYTNIKNADKYGEVFRTQFNGDIAFAVKDGAVSYDAATCFREVDGKSYFYRNGQLQKGAITGINESFYLTDANGAIKTGLIKYKKKYYMCTGTHGMARVQDGLIWYEGKLYHSWYTPYLTTGWKYVDGNKYYFSSKDAAAFVGRHKIGGKYYTFDDDGVYS